MASLTIPALEIPDDKLVTSRHNSHISPQVNLNNVRLFKPFGNNAVSLNIKYAEDRYELIGERKAFSYNPCEPLCPEGQYWDCEAGECTGPQYDHYVAEIVSGKMVLKLRWDSSTNSAIASNSIVFQNMSKHLILNHLSATGSTGLISLVDQDYGMTDLFGTDHGYNEYRKVSHTFSLQDSLTFGTSEHLIGEYELLLDNGMHYLLSEEETWNEAEQPDDLFPELLTLMSGINTSDDFSLIFNTTIKFNVYGIE